MRSIIASSALPFSLLRAVGLSAGLHAAAGGAALALVAVSGPAGDGTGEGPGVMMVELVGGGAAGEGRQWGQVLKIAPSTISADARAQMDQPCDLRDLTPSATDPGTDSSRPDPVDVTPSDVGVDSRLRGNDVESNGNDVERGGNDVEEFSPLRLEDDDGGGGGEGGRGGEGGGGGSGDGTGDGTGGGDGTGVAFASLAPAGGPPPAPRFIPASALVLPRPEYPEQARREGREGTVLLAVALGEDGAAAQVTVVRTSGSPLLDRAAAAAARLARYLPARSGGLPVPSTRRVAFTFRLTGGEE